MPCNDRLCAYCLEEGDPVSDELRALGSLYEAMIDYEHEVISARAVAHFASEVNEFDVPLDKFVSLIGVFGLHPERKGNECYYDIDSASPVFWEYIPDA